jgi:hypothetical protein
LRRDLLQIGRKVAPVTLGRVFGRLWAGSTAANMADGIAFVAFPLVATSLTSNPTLIAGLDFVYSLVRLLLAVPVGVVVDRLDHRMWDCQANGVSGVFISGPRRLACGRRR